MTVTNRGAFGYTILGNTVPDPFSTERIEQIAYPARSGILFSLIDIMIIGTRHKDTIGSDFFDFFPLPNYPPFRFQSQSTGLPVYAESARSSLDISAFFVDTMDCQVNDLVCGRNSVPLGLEVAQTSMAWRGEHLDDFVLVNFNIKNITTEVIERAYVVFSGGGHVRHKSKDPITTRLNSFIGHFKQGDISDCVLHPVEMVYALSDHGNPTNGAYDFTSEISGLGLTFLRSPHGSQAPRLNWMVPYLEGLHWWQPMQTALPRPYGRFSPNGFPLSDEDYYWIVSRPENDFDQILTYSGITPHWLPPPQLAESSAIYGNAIYYFSAGPFDLGPGQKTDIAVAIVGGDSVHTDPTAYERLFDPKNPKPYLDQLDFSHLKENAKWAEWVYDNPGYDTDGDGYRGEFVVCDGETTWVKGDGIADFRADIPPKPPVTKVNSTDGKLTIRWNGYRTENEKDPFTQNRDFEGYRVYLGRDSRPSSMNLLSSYDKENYVRWIFGRARSGAMEWMSLEDPFTLDSLRKMFNNPNFDPLAHPRSNPLSFDTSYYYFAKQDFNESGLTNPRGIRKAYPDALPVIGNDTSSWSEEQITREHGIPLPKYYEYEFVIDGILSSVPYHVAVTAFDFGYAGGGFAPQESRLEDNTIYAYAQTSADTVVKHAFDVYVYPNPYRIDQDYTTLGFENPDQTQIPERARRIHFANLPPKCTISIYSLDGDLVRSMEHDLPPDSPESSHHIWNMITRNTQLAVSGLYYWVVESPGRTQMGKLAIIK